VIAAAGGAGTVVIAAVQAITTSGMAPGEAVENVAPAGPKLEPPPPPPLPTPPTVLSAAPPPPPV
jgi:hypothetical protein